MAFFTWQNQRNRDILESQLRQEEIQKMSTARLQEQLALEKAQREAAAEGGQKQQDTLKNQLYQNIKNETPGISDQDAVQEAGKAYLKLVTSPAYLTTAQNQANTAKARNEAKFEAGRSPGIDQLGAATTGADIAVQQARKGQGEMEALTTAARKITAPQAAIAKDLADTAAGNKVSLFDTSQMGLIPQAAQSNVQSIIDENKAKNAENQNKFTLEKGRNMPTAINAANAGALESGNISSYLAVHPELSGQVHPTPLTATTPPPFNPNSMSTAGGLQFPGTQTGLINRTNNPAVLNPQVQPQGNARVLGVLNRQPLQR